MNNDLKVVGYGEGNVERTEIGVTNRDQTEQGFGVWRIGALDQKRQMQLDEGD
jgi:hypothetical protein